MWRLGFCDVMILPKEISQEMCRLQNIFWSIIMFFAPMYVVYHTRVKFCLICFFQLKGDFRQGSKVQGTWIQEFLLIKSFKLVPRPSDQGPRPKSGKLRLNLYGTCFGGKINRFGPKNSAKRRTPDFKNQESGQGPRYSPPQGFNLLQISPNWFLGTWTLHPWLKWA